MIKKITPEDQSRKSTVDNLNLKANVADQGESLEVMIASPEKELQLARSGATLKDKVLLDLVDQAIYHMIKADPTSSRLKSVIYNWLHTREKILRRRVRPRNDYDIINDIRANQNLLDILDELRINLEKLPLSRN